MRRFTLDVVALGITVAAGFGLAHTVITSEQAPQNTCQTVWADEVGQGTWDLLLQQGWNGVDGDVLYSPACPDKD